MEKNNIIYIVNNTKSLRYEAMFKLSTQLANIEQECFLQPWSAQSFLETFNNNLNYTFICANIKNHNIIYNTIGYIGFYEICKQCYVTNIAVLKDFQKLGIGSNLLSQTIEFAKNNLFEFISLEVRVSNLVAINLYKKFNFKQVGLRKNFYTDPVEDAFIFNLDLSY